mmetsp:Transcript_2390/g.3619  ORF Transcript_2390/g.3619 Transcript_2390/m.3619 type:complete len:228 (+) Transcript_2390:97-780(+)
MQQQNFSKLSWEVKDGRGSIKGPYSSSYILNMFQVKCINSSSRVRLQGHTSFKSLAMYFYLIEDDSHHPYSRNIIPSLKDFQTSNSINISHMVSNPSSEPLLSNLSFSNPNAFSLPHTYIDRPAGDPLSVMEKGISSYYNDYNFNESPNPVQLPHTNKALESEILTSTQNNEDGNIIVRKKKKSKKKKKKEENVMGDDDRNGGDAKKNNVNEEENDDDCKFDLPCDL